MRSRAPVRGTPLSHQVLEVLSERIRKGVYPPGSQLPTENELVAELNVSRTTIRSAIGALATRGLVVRRHGVGTFVSHLSRISHPLNEAVDFNHLIAANGFTPGVRFVSTGLVSPDESVAEQLGLDPDQPVFRTHKIFTADGEPMIYVTNSLPVWLFGDSLLSKVIAQPSITEPLLDFLDQQCNQKIDFHVAKIWADNARNCAFPRLPLEHDAPVLVIEEVGYNTDEVPVWHSFEYFPRNSMAFELIRYRSLTS